jgi:hypothetical protein
MTTLSRPSRRVQPTRPVVLVGAVLTGALVIGISLGAMAHNDPAVQPSPRPSGIWATTNAEPANLHGYQAGPGQPLDIDASWVVSQSEIDAVNRGPLAGSGSSESTDGGGDLLGRTPSAGAAAVGVCRGLSLASATDCSAQELLRIYCVDAREDEGACVGARG